MPTLKENCCCGASMEATGDWVDLNDQQRQFHEVHEVCRSHEKPRVSPSNSSELLCGKPGPQCKYWEFFNSSSCLFVEGVEFMTKSEIYDAIKKDWAKLTT